MTAPSLGYDAADWIEAHCLNGPGDVQGQPVVLTNEAIRFLVDAYELEPVTGRRRYKRTLLVRSKGWSKSELAAFVALFEALGPCRFDHWDDDGEPVGRPVSTPVIRCVATEESQAGNVYDNILYNLTQGPLARTPGLDAGLTRINLPNGGNIRPVSAGAASKDGGKETFVVFDEIHLFLLPELHRLHQTYLRNLRKRTGSDPWSFEITTAYRPGEGSVGETAMTYAAKIAAGESFDSGFLYDHRQASQHWDLDDPEQHMAALREAYGDCDWVSFEQIVKDWEDPTTDRIDHRRYFLSQVVTAADSYLDHAEWAAVADATLALHDGDRIALGMDTSLVDDGTALVACRLSDGYVQVLGYWQKPTDRSGIAWQVPYADVDACVREAFERYTATRLYADPQYVASYLEAWQRDFGNVVHAWPTNRPVPMGAAVERFSTAVKTKTSIAHDGSSLLTQHVGNARSWLSNGRVLVRKEARHSPRKIDALVAAILAYEARADALVAGEDVDTAPVRRRAWSF